MGDTVRICLWSGPRTISTALMYSFAQRSDCSVFDEPLYAHYLNSVSEENVDEVVSDAAYLVAMQAVSQQ